MIYTKFCVGPQAVQYLNEYHKVGGKNGSKIMKDGTSPELFRFIPHCMHYIYGTLKYMHIVFLYTFIMIFNVVKSITTR